MPLVSENKSLTTKLGVLESNFVVLDQSKENSFWVFKTKFFTDETRLVNLVHANLCLQADIGENLRRKHLSNL